MYAHCKFASRLFINYDANDSVIIIGCYPGPATWTDGTRAYRRVLDLVQCSARET